MSGRGRVERRGKTEEKKKSTHTSGATAAAVVHAHSEAADPYGRALSLRRGLRRRGRRVVGRRRRRGRRIRLLIWSSRRVALLLLLWRCGPAGKKKNVLREKESAFRHQGPGPDEHGIEQQSSCAPCSVR